MQPASVADGNVDEDEDEDEDGNGGVGVRVRDLTTPLRASGSRALTMRTPSPEGAPEGDMSRLRKLLLGLELV